MGKKFCFEGLPEREIGIVRYFNQLNGQGFGSIATADIGWTAEERKVMKQLGYDGMDMLRVWLD